MTWIVTRWAQPWWWRYLLAKRDFYAPSWPAVIWCRIRRHRAGVWWFNYSGSEPDYHCKGCGDDLS
jgi:hypothetical protein